MSFELFLQYFFSGLTYGCIYAVVAIGFNIIYNSTGIINFAQGEFVMLGSMMAFTFSQVMPLAFAVVLSVAITAGIGSIVELVFIRGLYKLSLFHLNMISGGLAILCVSVLLGSIEISARDFLLISISVIMAALAVVNGIWIFSYKFRSLAGKIHKPGVLQMIIMTIGVSIIIREIALHIWGEQVRTIPYFTGNEITSIKIMGAYFSPQVLWVLGITALIVTCLTLFFKFSMTGQAMRGCSASRDGAMLCGINTQFMVNISFALSAGIGALAGCVTAPLTETHYDIGADLAIKGFTVAILGGLGNSLGAVIAGLFLGILESYTITIYPEAYKGVITIAVLLLVLFIRPSGLFGSRTESSLKEY